jgi:hypothetical protein
MPHLAALLLAALSYQDPGRTGYSSPQTGDTAGYWQQRVTYTIVATLDESNQRIRASGRARYVNDSPDTLREMYVHQYLNAFRPASKWSAVDEREGRERFQRLPDPHFGYERFTAPVRVDGLAVSTDYPGAPDSTIAHFALPRPLAPRDSVLIEFAWDARPSTLPRRQGRRGRHWDLSQWFPKVAVYDRGGWQPNALQPAGEFYGEFGTYDVTLVVAQDQILAATGVPVSGDPGWTRVIRGGSARAASNAYDSLPTAPAVTVPAGFKAVRFFARDVHHFAWSASPDYRYDGGVYVRTRERATRLPTWDTVSVHVLWRPGDDTTWGGLRAVRRTVAALQWLEALYGPYPHPQLTTNHRLDGGGSELPMLLMNGSASQGLILHEGGHMFTFGVLANNEWRSGWMDEGATSYQTAWAQLLTPQERARAAGGTVDRSRRVTGYRALGVRMQLPRYEVVALGQATADILGDAQPMGTIAHLFRDFNTYNDMIYDRSEVMHGQLRDLLGDSLFMRFNHDYYERWGLKHVDERAMRGSVERVSGRNLDWFFEQWVHRTGLMDYRLGRVRRSRDSSGAWITEARVHRLAEYRHPMIVGVRTSAGWTLGRMSREPYDEETIRIVTPEEPREVRLDPHHVTWDWDRRNDIHRWPTRYTLDWPFLDQADREQGVSRLAPIVWYSEPGRVAVAARERSSYLGFVDRFEAGVGFVPKAREELASRHRIPRWFRVENPKFRGRPVMGLGFDFAAVDALNLVRLGYGRERIRSGRLLAFDVSVTRADVARLEHMPEQWEDVATLDLGGSGRLQRGAPRGYAFVEGAMSGGLADDRGYGKGEISVGGVRVRDRTRIALRAYAGATTTNVPAQRALYVGSADPLSTFFNHWWRPRGALLKRPGMNWLPLGGAGLRGFRWDLADRTLVGSNGEMAFRVMSLPVEGEPEIWVNVFGDVAHGDRNRLLSDAGIGLALRGQIYDREISVRLDAPVFVNRPALGLERDGVARDQLAARWVLSFNDLW